jgi:hypothetical protein
MRTASGESAKQSTTRNSLSSLSIQLNRRAILIKNEGRKGRSVGMGYLAFLPISFLWLRTNLGKSSTSSMPVELKSFGQNVGRTTA